MTKLVFIGGEDVRKTNAVRVHDSVLRNHPKSNVLIFPWAAPPGEKTELWMKIYRRKP